MPNNFSNKDNIIALTGEEISNVSGAGFYEIAREIKDFFASNQKARYCVYGVSTVVCIYLYMDIITILYGAALYHVLRIEGAV